MALNDVIFNISTAGLGQAPLGEDFISGMVAYVSSFPSGLSATANTVNVKSYAQAQAVGISADTTDALAYHVKEYFKENSDGDLWIAVSTSTATTFTEVTTLQQKADGKIRQMAVIQLDKAFDTANVTAIQGKADSLFTDHMPCQFLYAADMSGSTIGGLADLKALGANNVSVVVGQDKGGVGNDIFTATSKSVTAIGAYLGMISKAAVSENIGHIQRFNFIETSVNNDYDVLGFATGEDYNTQATSALSALNDKNYLFLRKHVGIQGSYAQDSWTSEARTNDLVSIENNRVIQKATRLIRTSVLPELNGRITLNADGTLDAATVARFKSLAGLGLEAMQRDGDVSAFKVIIDPAQPILQTSKLELTVQIVPRGISRNIEINIGFVVSV